jgi:hypothetical protein
MINVQQKQVPVLVALVTAISVQAAASELGLVGRDVFVPCRQAGIRVMATAFYTRPEGLEMMRLQSEETKSDKLDVTWRSFSSDHGRTWSQPERLETFEVVPGGTKRRYLHPGHPDPKTGVLITFIIQGVLPSDHPLEGMKHWTIRYALSRDGGRSTYHEAPVVCRGEEFTPEHPMPGIWIGKNSPMIGDTTCTTVFLKSGEILQPIQITPLGPDGQYHNPGGGYTYHDSAVLIGAWNKAGTIDWELSQLVRGDPEESTRGMLEPTLAEMPDGRLLMVMRGSNDRKPQRPGYRWYSVSKDRGRTWSQPRAWTYTNGRPFFSPSSCSQLLSHSNGRCYWIGNISPDNPRGNSPRYPLVIGQVDPDSLLLMRETLCTIDERRPGDADYLSFSNFYARQDRATDEIVIHCSPLGQHSRAPSSSSVATSSRTAGFDWTADALLYRVNTGD